MNTATQHQQPDPPPPWAAHLSVSDAPPTWLRLPAVLERTGYSERGWYRAMQEGRAPSGQRRGSTVVWSAYDIDAFVRWEMATLPPAHTQRKRRHG